MVCSLITATNVMDARLVVSPMRQKGMLINERTR